MKPQAIDGQRFEQVRPELVAAAFAAYSSGEGMSLARAIARDDFKIRLTDRQADAVEKRVCNLCRR